MILHLENTEIREVIEYLGIPYAAPPIGKLRFKVKTCQYIQFSICHFGIIDCEYKKEN